MFKVLSTYICWKKYIKCNIWMVAERGHPIYRTHGSERLTRWRRATAQKHQILLSVMAKSWEIHVCMFIIYLHTTFKVPVPSGYRNQTEKFTKFRTAAMLSFHLAQICFYSRITCTKFPSFCMTVTDLTDFILTITQENEINLSSVGRVP
jgi:hypothetical protein